MKRFAMTMLFALVFSVIPTRIWAQDHTNHNVNTIQNVQTRDYENGFLFNVFEIENVEERVQLASALATSDIWICNPTENPGELFIRPNSFNADIPIYAEFDYLRMTLREEYEAALLLSKEDFTEVYNSWARNISVNYYNFLISDHLDRANHCMDAEPFCTSDLYEFPAYNMDYSWDGPNYGCLFSSPTNKPSFWYYMRIGVAGDITILIEADFDVDFALWGPFTNQIDPCPTEAGQAGLLTATCSSCPNNTSSNSNYPYGNLHDCSYDPRHFEYAHVVNGQVGQYFILLITNFSNDPGYITFQKFAGDGETDCGIMPGIVNNDGPYCEGETIHLTVNEQPNATYAWTGPNGFTSNIQNPVIPNCTLAMAGTYTCTTTVGAQNTTASTEVVIYQQATPSFTATTVCQGNPTQFNGIAGEGLVYHWDFGDGQNENGQSVAHTYDQAGTYQVTLLVSNEDGSCPGEITQSVTVNAQPVADAGENQSLEFPGLSTTLNGSGGGTGYTYQWQPANMVVNPNSPTTQTVILYENQTYTLTVTNPQGGCFSTSQTTVYIGASPVIATAEATPNSLCNGESTQLHVNASGGSGNFSYSWTGTDGFTSTLQNPVVSPTQTTTYTCTITDNTTTEIKTANPVTVTVYQHHTGPDGGQLFISNPDCDSVMFEWFGNIISFNKDGVYSFPNEEYTEGQTIHGCDSTMVVTISNMKYTPHPVIENDDQDVENPHYPITATEFNVNRYTYKITDQVSDIATWNNEQCRWYIDKESWTIVPSNDNLSCTVYAMDWVEDTIWLSFKAVNSCSGEEGILAKYWLKPSFYGIEESDAFPAQVDVIPNPNNGEMELRFENLEGRIQVKVCNASGALIDSFEIQNRETTNTYNYSMKRLTNGVYFFTFSDGKRAITKKVVIIH